MLEGVTSIEFGQLASVELDSADQVMLDGEDRIGEVTSTTPDKEISKLPEELAGAENVASTG